MFNGILKSDDVEVYEIGSAGNRIALSENCKGLILIQGVSYTTQLELPNNAYIGKEITIALISGTNGTGKTVSNATVNITHSFNVVYTLKQGSITFRYVGQSLSGVVATNQALQGWIILGGVQGDTAITGYAGSVVHGSGAYAKGSDATTIGRGSNAADTSNAYGLNASTGNAYSNAFGVLAQTGSALYCNSYGYSAFSNTSRISFKSNAQFSTSGDAQAGKFILMRQTTDATPLAMSATNAAASTSNILILPNNSAYSFTGQVVARDASTGDCAKWNIDALMKRGANASTTALEGTPTVTKVFASAGAAAWTIALTADTTNGGGIITVTGEAGKTIRFVCNVDSAEVI